MRTPDGVRQLASAASQSPPILPTSVKPAWWVRVAYPPYEFPSEPPFTVGALRLPTLQDPHVSPTS